MTSRQPPSLPESSMEKPHHTIQKNIQPQVHMLTVNRSSLPVLFLLNQKQKNH